MAKTETVSSYFDRSIKFNGLRLCPICDHQMIVPQQYRARLCQWCGLVWHEDKEEAELSEHFDHGFYGRRSIPWTRPALITECYPKKIVLVAHGMKIIHDSDCEHPWESVGIAGMWAFCNKTKILFLRLSDRDG